MTWSYNKYVLESRKCHQRLLSKNWRLLVNLVLDSPRQILQDLRIVGVIGVFP